ncbi:MAG: hypothetical protein AVDCRST_MAG04-3248, partial [uncultured Acetobacteraceae bacterium]
VRPLRRRPAERSARCGMAGTGRTAHRGSAVQAGFRPAVAPARAGGAGGDGDGSALRARRPALRAPLAAVPL